MFRVGEAIRQARQFKNLTQEQLGNMIGVKKAQISRIESGNNLTLNTISRNFRAMKINLKLDMGDFGKVALV